MGRLDGQVSIITGGSRGIGRAVALKFADEGARLAVVAAHDRDALRQIGEQIAARGGDSITTLADVSRRDDVEGVVRSATGKDLMKATTTARYVLASSLGQSRGLMRNSALTAWVDCRRRSFVPRVTFRSRQRLNEGLQAYAGRRTLFGSHICRRYAGTG